MLRICVSLYYVFNVVNPCVIVRIHSLFVLFSKHSFTQIRNICFNFVIRIANTVYTQIRYSFISLFA
jgi:hypothetical protein